jgi:hypothetical protein
MKNKKNELHTLICDHNYLIIKGYESHKNKIEVACNSCQEIRVILPKSFLNNPECKGCIKKELNKVNQKKKITEMNIDIRRKAKKVGFKVTDWFESTPVNVDVHCRECNTKYNRAVNSLRNGLVCFNCKKNDNKTISTFLLDLSDLPELISHSKKNIKNIFSPSEKLFLNQLKTILRINNKTINYYDEEKSRFIFTDKTELKINKNNYIKKYLLGNSLKKIFNNDITKSIISGVNQNTTLSKIEESITVKYFIKQLNVFYKDTINSLTNKQVEILYKSIIPEYMFIKINQKNKFTGIEEINLNRYFPNKVKCFIEEEKIIVEFNNNVRFNFKIQTGTNRTTFSSWDNLFQECWHHLS